MSDNIGLLYQVHFTGLGFACPIISVISQPLLLFILCVFIIFVPVYKHLHSKKTKKKKSHGDR